MTVVRLVALCLMMSVITWQLPGGSPPLLWAAAATTAPSIPAGLTFQGYVDLGARYFRLGQYDLAVLALEAAVKKEQPARLYFNLARAYHKAGRLSDALAAYERYLRLEPLSPRRAEVESHCETLRIELGLKTPVPSPEEVARANVATSQPAPRPLYKRAWFWGTIAAGVVVIGTGVTLGVVLTRH